MKSFIKKIKPDHLKFLKKTFDAVADFKTANPVLLKISGINNFFRTNDEFLTFKTALKPSFVVKEEVDRREYGDFQTPAILSEQICSRLRDENIQPAAIIEPTFGKGAFILSSLKTFQSCELLVGVEIYEAYCWETKFKILDYFLDNPSINKPAIFLYNDDIFHFDFQRVQSLLKNREVLVIGNPPWVTNAELSSLKSENLPVKANFKNHKGLDAMTGKGNFDICETIILRMLKLFSHKNDSLAMLAKNSVIRNIVHDLPKTRYKVADIKTLRIDTKKFFNAAVDASLFICKFNGRETQWQCNVSSFEKPGKTIRDFGWVADKFVSNISLYRKNSNYDHKSPYEWRQGVKHDCSRVFELREEAGKWINGLGQCAEIEDDLVYGLAKSSDLKKPVITRPRKFVIITQQSIGESTLYIKTHFPKLYTYLKTHQEALNRRKSSIYKNKPPFSIFGIGDYSFQPYKVAVSGLYKTPAFSLLLPNDGKPIMVDDTCYQLGFDALAEAIFVWALLNHRHIQDLLSSITFLDSKRPFTKDILMRLDIHRLAKDLSFVEIANDVKARSEDLARKIDQEKWRSFLRTSETGSKEVTQLKSFNI